MLKKIFILLLLVITTICSGCKKREQPVADDLNTILNRGHIIVGVKTDSYPFGYIDKKGHYLGYDPALARLIAKGLFGNERKVKFVSVTPSNRMMKLYSGDIDMIIATMSVTPKRQELLDFSQSYYTAGQAILVRNGSKIKSIRDLNKQKAIIVFGSTSEMSLRAAVPHVQIVGYKTYGEAYKALKMGRADAIVSDDTILLNYALKDNTLKMLPKRYSKEPYAVAFRKGPESKNLVNAVNEIIKIETKNGNLKSIQKNLGIK